MRSITFATFLVAVSLGRLAFAEDPVSPPVPAQPKAAAPNPLVFTVPALESPSSESRIFSFYTGFADPQAVAADPLIAAEPMNSRTRAKQADGRGYTQTGNFIEVKLDRPKTELTFFEGETYYVHVKRDDVDWIPFPSSIISLEDESADDHTVCVKALQPGVTSLVFLNEDVLGVDGSDERYTVEITVTGDTRPLSTQLAKLYPQAAIQAIKIRDSVLLRGNVSNQNQVDQIVEIAQQYYPKVLNQLKVVDSETEQAARPAPPAIQSDDSLLTPPKVAQPQISPTQTFPQPVPPARRAADPQQVVMQALLLEIDWKQFAESKLDLEQTLRAFQSDAKAENPQNAGLPFAAFDVPNRSVDGIMRLLKAMKGVDILSRPQIRTQMGQPAEIYVGKALPLISGLKDEAAGNEYPRIGSTLKVMPLSAPTLSIRLEIAVEHTRYLGDPTVGKTLEEFGSNSKTQRFATVTVLEPGRSVILTTKAPTQDKKDDAVEEKGLMIVIAPAIVGSADSRPQAAAEPRPWRQIDAAPQGPVPASFDVAVRTVKEPNLQDSVRQLRGDVKALRQDVSRLIELLEKRQTEKDAKEWKDLSQQRTDKRERKLLFFYATWSGAEKEMIPVIRSQIEKGYDIETVDVDTHREAAVKYGVKSVPTIIEIRGGEAHHKWIGRLNREALIDIIEEHAPLRQPAKLNADAAPQVSQAEREIQQALDKRVSMRFEEAPLQDVLKSISESHDINVVLDKQGLEEEGLTEKAPVTIDIQGITLKSALNLMLKPHNLIHQVRDEVLVVTSRMRANGPMVVVSYPVADLVIPIPTTGPVPANESETSEEEGDGLQLSERKPTVDFDTLSELIQSAVHPESWSVYGGPASVQAYSTTLSLVIRQTPDVHEEIRELLAQLRRQQDLQVTLDPRFLDQVPQDLFEKMGVDFDFEKSDDNSDEFVAILTDKQAKSLLEAAQQDAQSNITQLPKVTLFNGQAAGMNSYAVGGKMTAWSHMMNMQPVISADRRNVRLSLRVSNRRAPATDTHAWVKNVPDGKTLLIQLKRNAGNDVGVPMLDKVPYVEKLFKNTGVRSNGARYLLIRPQIIVQEEEEELLGLPVEK